MRIGKMGLGWAYLGGRNYFAVLVINGECWSWLLTLQTFCIGRSFICMRFGGLFRCLRLGLLAGLFRANFLHLTNVQHVEQQHHAQAQKPLDANPSIDTLCPIY